MVEIGEKKKFLKINFPIHKQLKSLYMHIDNTLYIFSFV